MTEKRIKSTPGGAGPTSCARPSSEEYKANPIWDKWDAEKKRKEQLNTNILKSSNRD